MEDRKIVAVGFALCLAGIVLMVLPGTGVTGLTAFVVTLLVIAVVGLGVLLAVVAVTDTEDSSIRLPSPERRPRYHQAGADIGDRLNSVAVVGHRARSEDIEALDDSQLPRERLYAEVHELAVDVLSRATGCRRERAASKLADGTWTDDARAVAFFADDLTPTLSWRHRLPGVSSSSLPLVRRARHAIATLTETATGETVEPDQRTTRTAVETEYWISDDRSMTQMTGRVRQLLVAVLLLSGFGVLFGYPGVVLLASVGIALAAAGQFSAPTVSLTLSRTLEDTAPEPGDEVTVTVTVRNDSAETLADCRFLDGVPPGLEVVEDSPRFSTSLRPGKTATFTYTVEAVDGTHAFEPAIAIASDYFGASERVETVHVDGQPTTLSCGFEGELDTTEVLGPQVTVQSGRLEADVSGAGLEFDTVREYRRGDPPSRINWNHHAKTGTLSTVDFREPHRPTVALVVDVRQAAYVATPGSNIPAPRHSARAATEVGAGLLSDVVPVGLVTVGTDCWLPPRCGDTQEFELRDALAGTQAVPWTAPAESTSLDTVVETLLSQLSANTQLIVFSPLTDDDSVSLCRRLAVSGHEVTVLSPDCTAPTTVERAYGHLRRWCRCSQLRRDGISVHDWHPEQSLTEVLAREP